MTKEDRRRVTPSPPIIRIFTFTIYTAVVSASHASASQKVKGSHDVAVIGLHSSYPDDKDKIGQASSQGLKKTRFVHDVISLLREVTPKADVAVPAELLTKDKT